MSSSSADRRVLVTGASGLIGLDVVAELTASGADVLGVDLEPAGVRAQSYQHAQLDIREADGIHGLLGEFAPTDVIHLAALHMIPECESDPVACWSVNVSATVALARLAVEAGVRRFGLASSADVYAQGPESKKVGSSLTPTSVYGRSKRAAEEVVEAVARTSGMLGIIFRPFNVYGPRDTNPHLIPTIIDQAMNSDVVEAGDLTTIRDYVYVADAAHSIVQMMSSPNSTTSNIGTGIGHSGLEVVDIVRGLVNRDFTVQSVSERRRNVDRARLVSHGGSPGRCGVSLADGIQITVRDRLLHKTEVPV